MSVQRLLLIVVLLCGVLSACGRPANSMVEREFPDADPEAGREYLLAYGCGACHRIEGIRSAAGSVGPPLVNYEQRHYVAGNLKNTPANLIRWIRFPQEIEPGTAMPNLGVSEAEARAMVAYLYSH